MSLPLGQTPFIPLAAPFIGNKMIGKVFHCLTVIDKYVPTKGDSLWICKCSCGKETYAKTNDLTASIKKSCGHLRTERNRKYMQNKFRMGQENYGPGNKSLFSSGVGMDDALDDLGNL